MMKQVFKLCNTLIDELHKTQMILYFHLFQDVLKYVFKLPILNFYLCTDKLAFPLKN